MKTKRKSDIHHMESVDDQLNNSMFEYNAQDDGYDNKYVSRDDNIIHRYKNTPHTSHTSSGSSIHSTFYGRYKTVTIDSLNNHRVSTDEYVFGPMILNPSHRDFYSAWDNFFTTNIDSSRYKLHLISKLPTILCYQINRVVYNNQKGVSEKNNTRFEVPLDIYTDRYMYDNHIIIQSLRHKKMKLQREMDGIDAQISSYSSNTVHVSSSIQHVIDTADIHKDTSVLDALRSMKIRMDRQYGELLDKRRSVERDIRDVYNKIDRTRYVLYSIIIHEGTADSGHYYTFVRMSDDRWIKYNDYWYKYVSAEEVMEVSSGSSKNSNGCAYSVFYMSYDAYSSSPSHTYRLFDRDHKMRDSRYYEYIRHIDMSMVYDMNRQYEKQSITHMVNSMVNKYIGEYNSIVSHIEKSTHTYGRSLSSIHHYTYGIPQ